ncbi:ABC transporter ATP-binding protein [Pseudomaricurvus alkylphenolicus]|jgi:putative ABC transport system ATP-binding protein|uniref:ABC transporter ATP-binding protein n=1 Tax=Pseudomaricurvus alkylphenolicus TaxID=1306991 RepID=UPI0014223634|nr:ABC transporter ATP-binding protein [Pseudomaricurvus alkylphenolicus]NIB41435.1 ABC transporter ATP-binding protein [Pseudomaricurvus alkylphenolicus]
MAIQLKDVHFCYPEAPNKTVLCIKNWSVPEQEHVFIHGPSGSGKSTLLNLLSGMLRATQGEVSVLGQRLDQLSNRQRDKFRANHIGYIFQQFNLIPYLNPIDNIRLANRFSGGKTIASDVDNRIETLLATFNIPPSEWQKPVARLSIGQQQRIAITRAMINKPELLIADEPTSSLDPDNRDNFMTKLMSLAKEHRITLLFVSHDMSLSHYFDRIAPLSEINSAGASR